MPDQYNTNCVSHCTELQHFASQTLSCWCCWNDCFLNEYKSVWFYSLAVPVTPFFAVFSFIKVVCIWTFVISEPFNMQHRLLLMNGKIKALHFLLSPVLSLAVYHHDLFGFFFPSCCFPSHSPIFYFPIMYPSVSSWKSTLPLLLHSSCFPHVC